MEKIEAELKRWLPDKTSDQSQACEWSAVWKEKLFSGVGEKVSAESINVLLEPLRDIISRGGKRWRPLLMTLVCESLGGGDAAIPLSPLVEYPHNASLIHDDIEDGSEERRGKPAIHKIYGEDTAINSGTFFYFLSVSCIENAVATGKIKNKEQIYKLWAECLRRLHLGQSMDISWHRDVSYIPSIEDYYLMCGMKTGNLARLAAELGSHIAGAPPETVQQLGDAAQKLGIGFQILDDVKNLTTGIPGKRRGDDVVEGKKSLPVLLHMHKFPKKQNRVFYCFLTAKKEGVTVPEVEELIEMLTSDNVIAEAGEIGQTFINEARKTFSSHKLFEDFFRLIG